jgi:hypothetical protein
MGVEKQAELDAMTADQLRAAIVNAEGNLATIKASMEENAEFCDLRQKYKDASAGYSDGRKAQKAAIQYCLELLDAKGQPAGSQEAAQ